MKTESNNLNQKIPEVQDEIGEESADDFSDPCPECGCELLGAPGGGVKCPNCYYWFCY